MKKKLKDLLDYEQPAKYIVETENYSDEYETPVLTAGKSFVLGYTDETKGIFEGTKEPVIIFDDFTRDTKFVNFDFKVKSSAMKILHKHNEFDSLKYLHYAIKNIKYVPFAHKRLWISDFSNFEIYYPNPDDQQKIAAELDTIQSAIDNKKQQLSLLDEAVKSEFVEMFGENPVESGKWKVETLGNVAEIGSSKRIFAYEYVSEGIPFYRSKEIIELSKKLKPSVELFISEERYKEIKGKNGVPEVGDILMTAVGTIGKFWEVDTDKPFYYKDGNLVYIRTKTFNSTYFKHCLESLVEDFKQKNIVGSAYSALTIDRLKQMKIPIVDITLQNQFAAFVQQIDTTKTIIKTQLKDLNELLESKMDFYFME